jgi:heme exporter protein D
MFENFTNMGGYSAYVWPAYGGAALALIWLLLTSIRSAKRSEALLKKVRETQ